MLFICSAQHQHRLDQVEGSLEVFQSHSKLKVLDVEGTTIEGSIEVFQSTPSLQVLNMVGTLGRVSGDIKVFEHTKDLKVLRLNATDLKGDMEVVRFTQGLRELNLVNALKVTAIFSQLSRFFANLEKLVLVNSGPNVKGHPSPLATAEKLQELHIENAAAFEGDLLPLVFPTLRRLIFKGIKMFCDFTQMDHEFHQEFPPNLLDPQFSLSELHLEPKFEKNHGFNLDQDLDIDAKLFNATGVVGEL